MRDTMQTVLSRKKQKDAVRQDTVSRAGLLGLINGKKPLPKNPSHGVNMGESRAPAAPAKPVEKTQAGFRQKGGKPQSFTFPTVNVSKKYDTTPDIGPLNPTGKRQPLTEVIGTSGYTPEERKQRGL